MEGKSVLSQTLRDVNSIDIENLDTERPRSVNPMRSKLDGQACRPESRRINREDIKAPEFVLIQSNAPEEVREDIPSFMNDQTRNRPGDLDAAGLAERPCAIYGKKIEDCSVYLVERRPRRVGSSCL